MVLRTTFPPEAEATLLLVDRDHPSSFGGIDTLQHRYNLVHLWSLVWICIPASLHHSRKRARATPRYIWSQVLHLS